LEVTEVETGLGQEAVEEARPVLHPPEPGLHQRGQLAEAGFGEVGQGSLQVRPDCLTTISTTKKAELKTPDQKVVQIAVDDQLAASLGPFFNHRVVIATEQTTRWSTNTGRETRSYRMLDIRLAEPAAST